MNDVCEIVLDGGSPIYKAHSLHCFLLIMFSPLAPLPLKVVHLSSVLVEKALGGS